MGTERNKPCTCAVCGSTFLACHADAKYCSETCRNASYKVGRTPEQIRAYNRERMARFRTRRPKYAATSVAMSIHARRAGHPNEVSVADWEAICEAFDHRCAYCGARDKLTIDHVIPISQGGAHTEDNIIPACGACNFVKGRHGPLVMVNRAYAPRDAWNRSAA